MSELAPPVLEVVGLSFSYGPRVVLDEVTFDVRAGEFVGLIGSNGAGKTTLFQLVLGLLRPRGGTVRIGARTEPGRRTAVGYVPQRVHLDPDVPLRVQDVVQLGIDGARLGVSLPSSSRRRRVGDALEAVDASHLAGKRIGRLSGGEQQRVLIAHAIVGDPQLLVLDEPLANLDLPSVSATVSLLHRIAVDRRIAILISAHEMNPLLPVMDRIVYLAGGRCATGSVAEVVRTDVLSALYGHRVDVLHVGDRLLVVTGSSDAPVVDLDATPKGH